MEAESQDETNTEESTQIEKLLGIVEAQAGRIEKLEQTIGPIVSDLGMFKDAFNKLAAASQHNAMVLDDRLKLLEAANRFKI